MKENRGITLIALVVTIIILLILAGVSITTLSGNGLFGRAEAGAAKYQEASTKENTTIVAYMDKYDKYENQANNNGGAKKGENSNTNYTDSEGNIAVIPEGFTVSNKQGEQTISKGLVIKDNSGNEFVWIPINKNTLEVLNTSKKLAKLENGNYEGVLYKYDSAKNDYVEMDSSQGYVEPGITFVDIGDYTDEQCKEDFTRYGITLEKLQSEYNEFINSVKKNGGFYVSRYELALGNDGTAISKANKYPSTAEDSSTKTWFGLYNKAKTYHNSANAVKTTMIFQSAYDAILNFALANGNDSAKVTSNAYGNYSYSIKNTGTTSGDVINNIYDLAGNMFEWTTGVSTEEDDRVRKGGNYDGDHAYPKGNVPPTQTNEVSSWYDYDCDGTRMVLYIK